MKKTLALAIGLGFAALAQAQTLDRTVIAPAGITIGNPSTFSVDYTLGEMAIGSLSGTSSGLNPTTFILSQGYQQGGFARSLVRMATGELAELSDEAQQAEQKADALAGFDLKVYPNPTQGALYIDFSGFDAGKSTFTLLASDGKLVLAGEIQNLSQQLNLGNEKPGFYILRVVNPELKLDRSFRIVKQ